MIYFDATFLVKLHIAEPGSSKIVEFVRKRNEVVVSSVTARTEVMAALHRKFREGSTHAALLKAHEQFQREIEVGRIVFLMFTPSIVDRVEEAFLNLPANVLLRAGDAVHLATAAEARLNEIYSNDRHLLTAAPLFKLKGINPLAK
jgi:predicted nucleic acid-binding protein